MKPLLAYKCPPTMTNDEFLNSIFSSGQAWGGTPKIDGIRCITVLRGGKLEALSRTLKPIPNEHIRQMLSETAPYLDGELTVGKTFQACTSGIMSHGGTPDFTYFVFGAEINLPQWTYSQVDLNLAEYEKSLPGFCKVLRPVRITSRAMFDAYEAECLANGAEGVMLRRYDKGYKYGRSTLREGHLVAIKQFVDGEAVIVDFIPLYRNLNEATTNALGHTERSSHQANLVPDDLLGSLVVRDTTDNSVFNIGSGFDTSLRQYIWANRSALVGKLIKYKHQPHGRKDLPRAPIFLGFRHENDL